MPSVWWKRKQARPVSETKGLFTAYSVSKNREVIFMGKPMILLSSITYAMKGRDILFGKGIRSYVERTPFSKGGTGCGYSLFVPERTEEAEAILRGAGIRIVGRAERDGAR